MDRHKDDDHRSMAPAPRNAQARNPGRATTGGGVLRREPPPGHFKMSAYQVKNVVFKTPVGEFDYLQQALDAMRRAGIPCRDKDGNANYNRVDRKEAKRRTVRRSNNSYQGDY